MSGQSAVKRLGDDSIGESQAKKPRKACRDVLNSTVQSLLSEHPRRPVVLNHNMSVRSGLETLAHSKVHSAPVVLSGGLVDDNDIDTDGQFLGFVDTAQLAVAISTDANAMSQLLIQVLARDGALLFRTSTTMSIKDLIKTTFLAAADKKLLQHRVAIFNEYGHITGIISQADIVRFVWAHADMGWLGAQSISGLLGEKSGLVSVDQSAVMRDVFKTMVDNKVSCVAVLDGAGYLQDVISATDLKGVAEHALAKSLGETAATFLSRRQAGKHGKHGMRTRHSALRNRLFVVERGTAFKRAIERFVEHRVHHLIIVKDESQKDMKPVGIVSLTDVLRVLMRHGVDSQ